MAVRPWILLKSCDWRMAKPGDKPNGLFLEFQVAYRALIGQYVVCRPHRKDARVGSKIVRFDDAESGRVYCFG